MSANPVVAKRLLTIKQAAVTYPAFTESALRWLRFNGDSNGFNACVRRIGRRVLLDADRFERWIDDQTALGAFEAKIDGAEDAAALAGGGRRIRTREAQK